MCTNVLDVDKLFVVGVVCVTSAVQTNVFLSFGDYHDLVVRWYLYIHKFCMFQTINYQTKSFKIVILG